MNRDNLGRSEERVNPYQALGTIYDDVMDHVDYNGWADFVIDILRDYNGDSQNSAKPIRIIECGCGTGSLVIRLALSGFKITAFDKSKEMIAQAKSKGSQMQEPPDFMVADFGTFRSDKAYNVCLCLYDSVNYIMSQSALEEFFSNINQLLESDGILIFDICTEYNSITYFDNNSDENFGKGHHYTRKMTYDKVNRIQQNVFNIWFKSEPKKLYIETHQQMIYSESVVRAVVEKSGFTVLEIVDGFYRDRVRDDSLRIHFICRKAKSGKLLNK